MSLTPPDRDETLSFGVTVREDGAVVNRSRFETLEEAERFAEEWTEALVGAECEIEDLSPDHTGWQAVETDTAMGEEYPRASEVDAE